MAYSAVAGIYEIRNTLNNKVYIGSSINVKRRLAAHRNHLNRGAHATAHLQSSWDKYGPDAFAFRQLIVCAEKDLLFYEQRFMDGFKANQPSSGYNKRVVVESCAGMKLSPEHRAKIAASVPRGPAHQYYGKGLCKEAYQRAADLKRGKPMSQEQRDKISRTSKGVKKYAGFGAILSAARKGIGFSDEVKRNMSLAKKGRPQSAANILARAKLNYEKASEVRKLFADGMAQKDIAARFSIDKKTVNNVINGKTWT